MQLLPDAVFGPPAVLDAEFARAKPLPDAAFDSPLKPESPHAKPLPVAAFGPPAVLDAESLRTETLFAAPSSRAPALTPTEFPSAASSSDSSQSAVTPKAAASARSLDSSGSAAPVSHLLTACRETFSFSASAS